VAREVPHRLCSNNRQDVALPLNQKNSGASLPSVGLQNENKRTPFKPKEILQAQENHTHAPVFIVVYNLAPYFLPILD
jgi:hypothetical protein